jgi:hypothetical protein
MRLEKNRQAVDTFNPKEELADNNKNTYLTGVAA